MIKNYSLLSYGRVYNPVDWYYNPSYVVNRIYYIIGGTAYYKKDTRLKPGHLYIFRSLPDFMVSQSDDDPVDHVFFDFQTYKNLTNNDFIEIKLIEGTILEKFMEIVAEDFTSPEIEPEVARHYFELILYYVNDRLEPDNSYSDVTTAALSLLHNTPVPELSVSYIAEKLNRNENHIIRCFKNDVGMTPHKYISILKINTAIACISRDYSCTAIADMLGFSSIAAFSYFFKQNTGMNYSEYRKKNTSSKHIQHNYFSVTTSQ